MRKDGLLCKRQQNNLIKKNDHSKKEAYLSLGSNLNNPIDQINHALKALSSHPNITLIQCSSLYLTKPAGYLDQPDFVNAVIKINTFLAPNDLLGEVLAIENRFGRQRSFRNAPRILDIDILCYQDVTCVEKNLILPHPRLTKRAFILVPLAELAPDLMIPSYGRVKDLLMKIVRKGVKRLN